MSTNVENIGHIYQISNKEGSVMPVKMLRTLWSISSQNVKPLDRKKYGKSPKNFGHSEAYPGSNRALELSSDVALRISTQKIVTNS